LRAKKASLIRVGSYGAAMTIQRKKKDCNLYTLRGISTKFLP